MKPTERTTAGGLEQDVPLMPNAHDIAAGRDTVLEAARAWLLSSASESQKGASR